jgi:hypothetical protein
VNLQPFASCRDGCGDLEHDGTAAGADKAAGKHTKTTGHATCSGVLNTDAVAPDKSAATRGKVADA